MIETSAPSSEWGMHIRNCRGRSAGDPQEGSGAAVRNSCDLRKQAPVDQRDGEVSDRFPLDRHFVSIKCEWGPTSARMLTDVAIISDSPVTVSSPASPLDNVPLHERARGAVA
jgi:hypothetical protein